MSDIRILYKLIRKIALMGKGNFFTISKIYFYIKEYNSKMFSFAKIAQNPFISKKPNHPTSHVIFPYLFAGLTVSMPWTKTLLSSDKKAGIS
jgi:hypothetical protein